MIVSLSVCCTALSSCMSDCGPCEASCRVVLLIEVLLRFQLIEQIEMMCNQGKDGV